MQTCPFEKKRRTMVKIGKRMLSSNSQSAEEKIWKKLSGSVNCSFINFPKVGKGNTKVFFSVNYQWICDLKKVTFSYSKSPILTPRKGLTFSKDFFS